ncbi:hypothetical protein [Streptomyces xantholiticus]|uniref:hypothetical protein n=1 Tax=Streptomyces xantholiticus TaxID=68285 RepID=UPI00199E8717|nr:hypothetical protein [Streptomyces xantholiticus]GGW56259.1 hypothetical protein GCM10010381_47010 [Streptomyces xantholiticus]
MAAVVAVVMVSGCGAVSERRDAATAATERFEQALASGQYAEVCRALADVTRQEVEQSTGSPCEQGMSQEKVPDGGRVVHVDVYGRQVRAVLAEDTLFLSLFPAGWKVMAAGCTPQPEQPYQCEIKGG